MSGCLLHAALIPVYWNLAWPVRLPLPIIPCANDGDVSLRWIRTKEPRRGPKLVLTTSLPFGPETAAGTASESAVRSFSIGSAALAQNPNPAFVAGNHSRVGVGSSLEDCADEQASNPTATTKIRTINVFRIGYTYSTSGVSLRDERASPPPFLSTRNTRVTRTTFNVICPNIRPCHSFLRRRYKASER